MNDFSIGFIGLGLIGGSIAKSIHRIFPDYMLIESLLAFGATLANAVYLFDIPVRVTWLGYSVVCLFGGIFVGCLAGALTEVLNVIPIAARRFSVRRNLPYVIYALAAGKLIGSLISVAVGM